MIVRRYGTTVQSVDLDFDSKALNEVGFRRNREWSVPWEEFEGEWQRMAGHELEATADGSVHDETEQKVLDELERQIRALEEELGEGEVLMVESEQGNDYPKTRQRQRTLVERGENRLHFTIRIEPPLKLARFRRGS